MKIGELSAADFQTTEGTEGRRGHSPLDTGQPATDHYSQFMVRGVWAPSAASGVVDGDQGGAGDEGPQQDTHQKRLGAYRLEPGPGEGGAGQEEGNTESGGG